MNPRYLALECRRIIRSGRFMIFSLVMPAVLFVLLSGLYGGKDARYEDGASVTAALMVSMSAFGAMSAALSTGARVAVERGGGWQRQLRLTPMSASTYLYTKVIVAMLVSIPSILLVSLVGAVFQGVSLSAGGWVVATAGLWLGALPFAALGLLIGLTIPADSLPAIMGVSSMLLALLGGMWIPAQVAPGWLSAIMKATPSYWFTQLGQSALYDNKHLVTAIMVLAAWTVVAGLISARRFAGSAARA
ncbi:ABC transporter [Actinorhabdospora filicis]|uniref:ABC transporter n=1 Tax=Actinorhabdospora filicis TaxID=1785913 RepID=A0A9W6SL39_9ACTN|nr:ABC transporter permease [Actinorhabdospora filicis]GLZ78970.1 ABC transporter [Actinorhabdospora filicis]